MLLFVEEEPEALRREAITPVPLTAALLDRPHRWSLREASRTELYM